MVLCRLTTVLSSSLAAVCSSLPSGSCENSIPYLMSYSGLTHHREWWYNSEVCMLHDGQPAGLSVLLTWYYLFSGLSSWILNTLFPKTMPINMVAHVSLSDLLLSQSMHWWHWFQLKWHCIWHSWASTETMPHIILSWERVYFIAITLVLLVTSLTSKCSSSHEDRR